MIVDYRCGRNLARTFLHYYCFINVLPMPLTKELKTKGRRRPKTHQSQSQRHRRYEVQPRPVTIRCHAPISYTNLSICYDDSGASSIMDSNYSPLRSYGVAPVSGHFSGHHKTTTTPTTPALISYPPLNEHYLNLLRLRGTVNPDYYNTSGYKNTYYTQHLRQRSTHSVERYRPQTSAGGEEVAITVPPRPYLSIIDLNQLTRGSFSTSKGGSNQ